MEWTVVRNRRAHAHIPKKSSRTSSCLAPNPLDFVKLQLWEGRQESVGEVRVQPQMSKLAKAGDIEVDLDTILLKIQKATRKVDESKFYKKFLKQLQELAVLERLHQNAEASRKEPQGFDPWALTEGDDDSEGKKGSIIGTEFSEDNGQCKSTRIVLDTDAQDLSCQALDMVVYGLGSIAESEVSRCQLSLALLMKKELKVISKVSVYDPILTPVECSVLKALGCGSLDSNEEGRRKIHRPTLFYMPHCEVGLYNNVVETLLEDRFLEQIAILGNSFLKYQERWEISPPPNGVKPDSLLQVQEFVEEFPVDDGAFIHLSAFNDMSWHFFPRKLM